MRCSGMLNCFKRVRRARFAGLTAERNRSQFSRRGRRRRRRRSAIQPLPVQWSGDPVFRTWAGAASLRRSPERPRDTGAMAKRQLLARPAARKARTTGAGPPSMIDRGGTAAAPRSGPALALTRATPDVAAPCARERILRQPSHARVVARASDRTGDTGCSSR